MALNLPPNPFISLFDFKVVFDLILGKLKVDLSPSVASNVSGVDGVKLEIYFPNNTSVVPDAYVFNSANFLGEYAVSLPTISNTYVWGVYKVVAKITVSGVEYPAVTKEFNLCAVNRDDVFSNEMVGSITLVLDCSKGLITGSGFSGMGYKNISPDTETYNITHYFPQESEIAPQKNISVVPFQVDAYIGNHIVKGANVSTYKFEDHIWVIVKVVAKNEKNVRCNVEFDGLIMAVEQMLKRAACTADYCELFCEINPLLWLVTMGVSSGRDVSDYIDKLEKLLNVECKCCLPIGSKVGTSTTNSCPTVANLAAVINDLTLSISFNSANLPVGSALSVYYRPKSSSPNGAWTALSPIVGSTGTSQLLNVAVSASVQYEVKVVTNCPTGTFSNDVIVDSNIPLGCPNIIGVEGTGYQGSSTSTNAPTTIPATTLPVVTTNPPTTLGAQTTNNNTTQAHTTQAPTTAGNQTIPPQTTIPPTTVAGCKPPSNVQVIDPPQTTIPPTTIAPGDGYQAYWGYKSAKGVLPESQIVLGLTATFPHNADATADWSGNSSPMILWYAEPITEPLKVKYQDTVNLINNGNIGTTDDLFGAAATSGRFRYYETNYKTQMRYPVNLKKQ